MELGLEGILETMLVGSIASLFLLSVLFLFFGHVFRVEPVRRIAELALYEQRFLREEKPVEVESRGGEMSFALVLLVALLYGLGATVESITHDISLYKDKTIKAESFAKVGRGQVEGQTAPAAFARFVTDDLACRELGVPASAEGDASPCDEIYRREREFYYSAKNTVFEKESFAHELSLLQSRIDFVRSACISLGLLAIATLLATILAAIFERVVEDEAPPPAGLRHGKAPPRTRRQHWKEFAALRCLLITILLGALFGVSYVAWAKVETQYDRRVFGYYLALQDGRSPEPNAPAGQGGGDAGDRATADHESPEQHGPAAHQDPQGHQGAEDHQGGNPYGTLPTSPYRLFSGPWQEAFEPSGIVVLQGASHFLVSNDHGGAHPFLLFAHDQTGLGAVRRLAITGDDQGGLLSRKPKFESLVALPPGPDGKSPHRVLALVDRPAVTGELVGLTLSIDVTNARSSIERVDHFGDPCAAAASDYVSRKDINRQIRDVSSIDSCTIEGAVVRGDQLLLGVRHLRGKRNERDGKVPHIPTTAIVAVPFARDAKGVLPKGPAKVILSAPWMSGPCAEHAGISDMQVFDEDHLLVLTSVELQDGDRCSDAPKRHQPNPVAQVQGALWLVKDHGPPPEEPARLLHRFTHKPEGVTKLADGTALVVFDDDGSRKSVSRAPQTFPLAPSESVYAVVPLPR